MKSIKCSQCGLANWETAQWCQRCKATMQPNGSANYSPSDSNPFNQSQTNQNTQNSYAKSNNFYANGNGFDEKNGFVAKNIARCSRNALLACVLTIVAVIGGFVLNSRYLYNAAFGAFAVTNEDVQFGKNPPDSFRYYLHINSEEVFDTGTRYVMQEAGRAETVSYKYVALQVGDKLLLAKVDPDSNLVDGAKNVPVNGAIERMDSTESEKVLQPIFKEQPELRSEFLPYLLDARGGFRTPAFIGVGIGAVLLLVAGGFLLSVLDKFGNLEKSSMMKSLANYGAPREVAAAIDREVLSAHEKVGPVRLLPSWIIKSGTFSVDFQHVEEIVWMYKKVTKHSVNFIPTGKTYEVVLYNSQGKTITLSGSFMREKKVDFILDSIYQRVPWIITGYDNDLVKTWNSNSAAFVQAVRERRNSYENAKPKNDAAI
jgi:hypothetical protein